MTDRLGEALAEYDDHVAKRGYATAEDMAELAAAARNWHALTNREAAERIGQAIRDREPEWMRETVESYFVNTDALARIAVDALTVTAEPDNA